MKTRTYLHRSDQWRIKVFDAVAMWWLTKSDFKWPVHYDFYVICLQYIPCHQTQVVYSKIVSFPEGFQVLLRLNMTKKQWWICGILIWFTKHSLRCMAHSLKLLYLPEVGSVPSLEWSSGTGKGAIGWESNILLIAISICIVFFCCSCQYTYILYRQSFLWIIL